MPVIVPAPANMNYANLIEEKSLKKTFIIATLVSTVVGTFAASHNLYERFTQKKKDGAQDEAIKGLSEKIDKLQAGGGSGGSGGNDNNANSTPSNNKGKQDELKVSLDAAGALIRREFDAGYDRLGRRFAVGDLIAENELQRQVIMLQQTVIRVLEDALYNGRYIDAAGIDRLLYASHAARNGSLDALRGQYQRLLLELPPPPEPSFVIRSRRNSPAPPQEFIRVSEVSGSSKSREPTPAPLLRRLAPPPPPPPPKGFQEVTRVTEVKKEKAREPTPTTRAPSPGQSSSKKQPSSNITIRKLTKTKVVPGGDGIDFFCRYSLDLQRTSDLPLSRTFDPGRLVTHCPACRVPLAVDTTDMWDIEIPILIRTKAETVEQQEQQQRGRSRSRSGKKREKEDLVITETVRKRKEIKRFRIPARFVIKCHAPEGDFVCVLCCGPQDGYKGEVVLCDDAESLVDHVAREHRVGDIENEWDILPG